MPKKKLLLAIESSCDETAAALIDLDGHIHADIVSTQMARHAQYGGVVPEVASREHLVSLPWVVQQALLQAHANWTDLVAVAATAGPGLIGSLFVGVMYAKGIALGLGIPFLAINHLAGHLAAIDLAEEVPTYPCLALLVSGGHTSLYALKQPDDAQLLGTTLDDAAGEAFDKTAKMLGFPYPGGVALSHAAKTGNRAAVSFPIALNSRKNSLDFSFSGLKTAVSIYLAEEKKQDRSIVLADVCASIEHAIVEALTRKTMLACEQMQNFQVVLAGGVAANSYLRERLGLLLQEKGGRLYVPPKKWCTDNAAMIAAAALRAYQKGGRTDLSFAPRAYWPYA